MKDDLGEILRRYGVLRTGHCLLTSELHSDRYFEKFRILEQPRLCELFARLIADHYRPAGATIVCGPTTGGAIIAYEVARQLDTRCIIAEKSETGRKIGRGFVITPADQILVVDDVLTTGGSIRDTIAALQATGAGIVGIGVFINRSHGVSLPYPLFSAYSEPLSTYEPQQCPLCHAGLPLEIPGRSDKIEQI